MALVLIDYSDVVAKTRSGRGETLTLRRHDIRLFQTNSQDPITLSQASTNVAMAASARRRWFCVPKLSTLRHSLLSGLSGELGLRWPFTPRLTAMRLAGSLLAISTLHSRIGNKDRRAGSSNSRSDAHVKG
ncbi:MAG: hypothetical protein M1823_004294 [Watsoniomyces obsoletus]|nr:MAG: hypothetical protein M1823_004294 [Watsoniomyces obsoletus]